MMWLTLLHYGSAALFLTMTFAALFHSRWARRLPSLASLDAEPRRGGKIESRVRCSVVVAARDEEARIEETVRHLLAQRGVSVEVIVVDHDLDEVHPKTNGKPIRADRKGLSIVASGKSPPRKKRDSGANFRGGSFV